MAYIQGFLKLIWESAMSYTAVKYFALVAIAFLLYYIIPKKVRWSVLLLASFVFLLSVSDGYGMILVFAFSILVSYLAGIGISKKEGLASVAFLIFGITASVTPLIVTRIIGFLSSENIFVSIGGWITPIGLSFYSLQIISYLVDIYRGRFEPQKNPFKYALYVSFFPILIQGPISRYDQLGEQLYAGHAYKTENLMRGIQSILWGLFLKLMIADKAAVYVDAIFGGDRYFTGFYILVAAILYSIQLYTDFQSCVTISQGVGELFGIHITDNFRRPYFSSSVREFWRRWHISLSEWLRDYIYIPMGGNRKGKIRKYFNLFVTFTVSGIWHGASLKFLLWGWLHAGYQIIGDIIRKPKDFLLTKLSLPTGSGVRRFLETVVTFFLVMIAWIFFRADSFSEGLTMIGSMFSSFNPWILFNGSLYQFGLSQQEFIVLGLSILLLILVGHFQEKGVLIKDVFNRQNLVIRWSAYLLIIWTIWIFGTYGFGFDSSDFIYGGF